MAAESDAQVPAATLIERVDAVARKSEWRAEGCEITVEGVRTSIDHQETAPAVMFKFGSHKLVKLSRKLDASRINQIDLYMIASDAVWVTAELVGKGQRLAVTRAQRYPSSYEAFHVRESFLWPLPEAAEADELYLWFNGEAERVALVSVELLDQPPSGFAEFGSEEPFLFEGLARPSQWATSRSRLSARTKVSASSELTFDYLQPLRVRRRLGAPSLVALVEDAAGHVVRQAFELPGGSERPSQWQSARIPLDVLDPGPVEVRFEIDGKRDAACLVSNIALVEPSASIRPSVLLVTSDTHRADHVRVVGARTDVETPVLDRLAAAGVLFVDCFSAANSTNPSHTSLMTGVHTRDVGISDNATPLLPGAATLAESFRALGYRTFSAVSIEHLTHRVSGLGQGFDSESEPYPSGERTADETIDAALRLLDGVGSEPVFLWVHLFDAHAPYTPPPAFDRRYYPGGGDPFDPAKPELGIPAAKLAPELQGLRDLEFPRAQYKGEVSYLDSALARLFDAPRFVSGAVAFVADHGECLGEHGVYYDHSGLFPQTVHVPLILRWPGNPVGARSTARVMSVDIGRTLLAIAGDTSQRFPGRDLRERLTPAAVDDEPRFMISGNFTSAAIETKTHYLILTLADPQDPRLDAQIGPHRVFLYDRKADPASEHDIASAQPQVARELRARLVQWLKQRRSLGWAGGRSNDAEFLAQLAKLGYADVQRAADKPLWEDDDCAECQRYR